MNHKLLIFEKYKKFLFYIMFPLIIFITASCDNSPSRSEVKEEVSNDDSSSEETIVTNKVSPLWGKDINQKDKSVKEYSSDRIIVKYKAGIASNLVSNFHNRVGVAYLKKMGQIGISVLKIVDKNIKVEKVLKELRNSPLVEYAELDYVIHINETIPNDPQFENLWGLHNTGQNGGNNDVDIDAPETWDTRTTSTDVVMAVIDTGVDYTHRDLSANMWRNPGEIADNGIDDDNNGYVDDIYGIDAVNNDSDPFDDHSHGTHVSGTIGAVGNNGLDVVGVNWAGNIMALKFLNSSGFGSLSGAIECLNYAVMMKTEYGVNIKLTNNSWSGGGYSQALYDAIEASGNAGMLFVAAAGNHYGNNNDINPVYPASYDLPNIIAVAATDRNDNLAYFSNFGLNSVDLSAPGVDILSTVPGDAIASYSGTSMAAPHVAGAAGLLFAQHPDWTILDVKDTLMSKVDPVDTLLGKVASNGRLNAHKAIICTEGDPIIVHSLEDSFMVTQGDEKVLTVKLSDCGLLKDVTITAHFSSGDAELVFEDNGLAPDITANDGVFTATWTPVEVGGLSVTINATHNSNVYTVIVNGTVMEGYHFDDTVTFNWNDVSSTGTPLNLNDDDYGHFSIPFRFNFYDNSYNSLSVSSNGLVYFTDDQTGAVYNNSSIPTINPGIPLIAGLWDDLNPEIGGEVYWEVQGEGQSRKVIIQFTDVPHYNNIGSVSFQIILNEGSGDILFNYLDVDFGNTTFDNGASATVAIQNSSVDGLQYSFNAPNLTNNMAIRFYRSQVQDHLLLQNIVVNGGEIREWQHSNSIVAAGNSTYFTVANGGNVTFISGNSMSLNLWQQNPVGFDLKST